MSIKISIVIPSFNQGEYIGQTISSILDQQYSNLELIVIDGGSSDRTVEVLHQYDKQLAYWVSEPDRGQAHAINKGLAVCTGEIFNWINSDDFLEKDALKLIGDYFSLHPDKNVACGYTRCFWNHDNTTSHEYRMGVKSSVAETIASVEMNQPGSFYKTSVVRSIGGVNESLRYVFDDELWFRYLCSYGLSGVGFLDQRVAQFRLHGNSKSVGEGFDLFNKEIHSLNIELAEAAGAPQWLINALHTQPHAQTYISRGPWDISCLETEKYKAFFAAKFINHLYLSGQRNAAKEALRMVISEGYFKWNRMMTSLRLKLMV